MKNSELYALTNAGGGGSDIDLINVMITENTTTTAPSGKAYKKVTTNVPNPSTGDLPITANGNYDVTDKASVSVNVPNPSTGTLPITTNGEHDVTDYATASVNVPQGLPIEVSTAAGMTAVLIAANVGKAYKFTGTTDADYTNGDIYVVEAE